MAAKGFLKVADIEEAAIVAEEFGKANASMAEVAVVANATAQIIDAYAPALAIDGMTGYAVYEDGDSCGTTVTAAKAGDAYTITGKKIAVVPILRAGLGLVDGVLRMVPSARVGHIGMFRDEETLEPHVYFCKMPKDIAERDIMIVDPMLATGGSACEAIGEMVKRGCKHITLMVLVAAPEGIKAVQEKYPDVNIYAGALDDHLNEHGYIVPGLGDAGDRKSVV